MPRKIASRIVWRTSPFKNCCGGRSRVRYDVTLPCSQQNEYQGSLKAATLSYMHANHHNDFGITR